MKLFEKGNIGRLSLKNRIVMAAMGIPAFVEPDGRFSQRAIDYYIERAKGGTGLIITWGIRISRDIEHLFIHPLGDRFYADSNIYGFKLNELAEAVHDYGCKIAVQLTPGNGRTAPLEIIRSGSVAAASSIPFFADKNITTRELSINEIEQLVQDSEYVAQRISRAGIDAIELHAHGGHLLDQFQTSLWNKRTDKYGGDLNGRLRFVLEIIEAIKKGAGEDFPIIYRYGLTHYISGGRDVNEGLEIAHIMEDAGVAALDIDAGCPDSWYWYLPPSTQPPGCYVDLAEKVKHVVKIPVIVAGKLGYPELAEQVLQENKADFIALGRPLLADADWANKVKKQRAEDIRPCLGCFEGCIKRSREFKYLSCAVNPQTGMERDFRILPANIKKTVLVVGGGPGGMEAAMTAALRGHKVFLWEKGSVLGGNLLPAAVPDFKRDYKNLIVYLSTQLRKLGVTIELNHEATKELIINMMPDIVVIATGSNTIIPEIPGVNKQVVVTCNDLLLSNKEAGHSVMIIGGGLVGSETALWLGQKGKKITIVEILGDIARDMFLINRLHLLKLLEDVNVEVLTDSRVVDINDDGVSIVNKEGNKRIIMVDSIALAVGRKSNNELFKIINNEIPEMEIYAIGDCVQPRKVINAIWEGFRTARLI